MSENIQMEVKTIKLQNIQFNLVHYFQYYDFETIQDIKKSLLMKYRGRLNKLCNNREVSSISFDKITNDDKKINTLPNNNTLYFKFEFTDSKDSKSIQSTQKNDAPSVR